MNVRIVIISCLLFFSFKLFGQGKLYFELSGNLTFIPGMEQVDENSFTDIFGNSVSTRITEEFETKPGFSLESGYDICLGEKFILSPGIGFSYHQFKRVLRLEFLDTNESLDGNLLTGTGNPVADYFGTLPGDVKFRDLNAGTEDSVSFADSNNGETKILYLAIPFNLSYRLIPDRLNVGIGFTNYFITWSSQVKSFMDINPEGGFIQKEYEDTSSDGLTNFLAGGHASVELRIIEGLWLHTSYKQVFFAIYDKAGPIDYPNFRNEKASYRSMSLGLKYRF